MVEKDAQNRRKFRRLCVYARKNRLKKTRIVRIIKKLF